MNSIFGSLSTDSLPDGYGDEGQVSNPTGGTVGGLGFADAMQVAGSGSVSPFGYDADMSGLPSGEYAGWLADRRAAKSAGAEAGGEEDSGGRTKLFGSEGYFGKEARTDRQETRQGKRALKQFEKDYAKAEKEAAGGGKKGKKKKPMSGQRAANIGAGLGSFFAQAAPTVAGLFGPQQQLEPMDSGGGYTPPPKSGTSPLLIGGAVVGGLLLIGGIAFAVSSSGKE